MRKIIISLVLILMNTGHLLALEFPFTGKVNTNKVNLRAGPGTGLESLDILETGDKVNILIQRYKWYKIKLPQVTPCFISSKYIKPDPGSKQGTVIGNRVSLRAGPSMSATIIGQVNKKDRLKIIKSQLGWYKVAGAGNFAFAWIYSKFIDEYIPPEPVLKHDIIKPEPVASGLIRPLGIFFRRKGTHKLLVDGKSAYRLKGDRQLLDSFVGYKVNIFGTIEDTANQKNSVINVERIELIK